MNTFSIRLALFDLVEIGHNTIAKFGHPCSHLIRQSMLYPTSHDDLVQRIFDGKQVEFRLNGAGLKLYSHHGPRGLYIIIGGDQSHLFPEFVFQANEKLKGLRLQNTLP